MFIWVLFTRLCLYQYWIHLIHWIFLRLCAAEILKTEVFQKDVSLLQYNLSLTQLLQTFMIATLQPISPPEKMIQVL